MRLALKEYAEVVLKMPILCVDGIIRNEKGHYLLIKRKNEPLKGQWWVPGGRVYKGEKLEDGFRRKIREELGIEVRITGIEGYFEDEYAIRTFGREDQLHTVSIVFSATPLTLNVKLDGQSSEWGFFERLPARLQLNRLFRNSE